MGFIFTRMLYFCVYHVIRRILYILFANHFVIVVGCGRVFQVTCLIENFFKWSVASEILVWTSRIGFMEVGCLHALRSSSVLLTIIIYGFPGLPPGIGRSFRIQNIGLRQPRLTMCLFSRITWLTLSLRRFEIMDCILISVWEIPKRLLLQCLFVYRTFILPSAHWNFYL